MIKFIKQKLTRLQFPRKYRAVPISKLDGDFIVFYNGWNAQPTSLPSEIIQRFQLPLNLDGEPFFSSSSDSCNATFLVLKYEFFTGIVIREIENRIYNAFNVYTQQRYKSTSALYQDPSDYAAVLISDWSGWVVCKVDE